MGWNASTKSKLWSGIGCTAGIVMLCGKTHHNENCCSLVLGLCRFALNKEYAVDINHELVDESPIVLEQ